tara:strand:+ start:45 stop:431 length:387 start_codon:yes stop_codon:yes gene_type:complete
MIAKAIYGILSNDADVISYVSTRIYPNVIPENVDFPAISFYISSSNPDNQKVDASSLNTCTVQVKCVHDDYLLNTELADYVRIALDKLKGTHYTIEIQTTFFNGTDDLYDSTAQKHMKILNFNFIYKY